MKNKKLEATQKEAAEWEICADFLALALRQFQERGQVDFHDKSLAFYHQLKVKAARKA